MLALKKTPNFKINLLPKNWKNQLIQEYVLGPVLIAPPESYFSGMWLIFGLIGMIREHCTICLYVSNSVGISLTSQAPNSYMSLSYI